MNTIRVILWFCTKSKRETYKKRWNTRLAKLSPGCEPRNQDRRQTDTDAFCFVAVQSWWWKRGKTELISMLRCPAGSGVENHQACIHAGRRKATELHAAQKPGRSQMFTFRCRRNYDAPTLLTTSGPVLAAHARWKKTCSDILIDSSLCRRMLRCAQLYLLTDGLVWLMHGVGL